MIVNVGVVAPDKDCLLEIADSIRHHIHDHYLDLRSEVPWAEVLLERLKRLEEELGKR